MRQFKVSIRQTTSFLLAAALLIAALALPSMMPSLASAQVIVPGGFFANIDDTTDVLLGSLDDKAYVAPANPFFLSGPYGTHSSEFGVIRNEDIGVLGQVSIRVVYADPTPLAPDHSQTMNFMMFEPEAPTQISDTLSITFTGFTPNPADPFNMVVTLQFLSGSSDDKVDPPALPNAIVVPENSDVTSLVAQATGLSNFHVQFASVPEPGTFISLGVGILSLLGCHLWKRAYH